MKFLLCILGIVVSAVTYAEGEQPAPVPVAPTLEEFAALPPIMYPALSESGNKVAMMCEGGGHYGFCIVDLQDKSKSMRSEIGKGEKIMAVHWVGDHHVLVYVKQIKSVPFDLEVRDLEYRRIYSFNVATKKGTVLMNNMGGSILSLTNLIGFPEDKNAVLMELVVSDSQDNMKSQAFVYEVDLDSGRGKRVKEGETNSVNIVTDGKGEFIAQEIFNDRANSYSILRSKDKETIFKTKDTPIQPLSIEGVMDKGKSLAVFFNDDRGAMSLSLETGELKPLIVDGVTIGTSANVITDFFTNELVGFSNWDGELPDQKFVDPLLAKVKNALTKAQGGKRVVINSWSKDRKRFVFELHSAGTPIEYYDFNMKDGLMEFLGSEARFPNDRKLSQVSHIKYKAKDDLEIDAFLTLPNGKTEKQGPFPTILLPHGGPVAFDTAGYDWMAQFYASLGYAILQPNFRGSAGYGPGFRDAGFGEYGGKMVTDVIDGYDYLVKQGIAKPDGFCAIGWSYGGYSVLQIAAIVPQKTKCVVAVGAVTDPYVRKRQISQSGDETATYIAQFIGEKDNPEFKPTMQVAKVTAPILMVHGIYDKTVNFTQAKAYRSALKERADDKDKFRLIEVEGEDHYFLDTPTRQMLLKESSAWLKKNFPVQ